MGGVRGRPGRGRCTFSPSAGLAHCDGEGTASSRWDPFHAESPRWAASGVGGLWVREIALLPPFRSQMGTYSSSSSPTDSETLSPRVPLPACPSRAAGGPESCPLRWIWVCVEGHGNGVGGGTAGHRALRQWTADGTALRCFL